MSCCSLITGENSRDWEGFKNERDSSWAGQLKIYLISWQMFCSFYKFCSQSDDSQGPWLRDASWIENLNSKTLDCIKVTVFSIWEINQNLNIWVISIPKDFQDLHTRKAQLDQNLRFQKREMMAREFLNLKIFKFRASKFGPLRRF